MKGVWGKLFCKKVFPNNLIELTLITDEINGYLVPVGDIKAMADKMTQIADHNEISQYLSANGLRLREQLSIRCIAEEWLDYIRNIQTK